jgi:catechol 2,3-dioxygenase-like lactoylglutathione lyase family enzyme
MKLEHVALNVSNPKEACAWYEEHLGMKIVLANDLEPYIHFLSDGQGSMIELYSNPIVEVPDYGAINPFTFHLAFTVDDLEGEINRLVEVGARQEGDIQVIAGNRLVFLRDPWNLTVQLVVRSVPFST